MADVDPIHSRVVHVRRELRRLHRRMKFSVQRPVFERSAAELAASLDANDIRRGLQLCAELRQLTTPRAVTRADPSPGLRP